MNTYLKSGLLYTAFGKFSNMGIQLLINAVLSRLLTPKDYGIVAVVQVFIVFFQMLTEAGMGPAIIQNKNLNQDDYGILFNFSIIFAGILAGSFGLFGNVIAWIYHDDIYLIICWVQSISIFITGLNIVPTALMNKEKKFKRLNFIIVIANFCGGLVGIITAFLGWGVYALIFNTIVMQTISFIFLFLQVKIKLKRSFDLAPIKQIWNFAKNQFGFNFVNYFSRNADNLLIGKFMGEAALGNYSKAYQLLMLPNSVLLGVINPVLQPVLADYQDDVEYIRETYFKVVHILALIGVPLSVFLFFSAKEVIFFMFGNQWGMAIFPFMILSLSVWIQMTTSSSGAIFQARDKVNYLLITGIISACIIVFSILVGIYLGSINSVAVCLTVGFYANFITVFYVITKHVLDTKLFNLLKEIKIPLIMGFCLAGVFLLLNPFFSAITNNTFILLIIKSIVFLVVFFIELTLFKEMNNLKQLVNKG